jgi:hypothetical protein
MFKITRNTLLFDCYLATSIDLGHYQAIRQEHKCIQKPHTVRQKIPPFFTSYSV